MVSIRTPNHLHWLYGQNNETLNFGDPIHSAYQREANAGKGFDHLLVDGCFEVWGGYLGVEKLAKHGSWRIMWRRRNMTKGRTRSSTGYGTGKSHIDLSDGGNVFRSIESDRASICLSRERVRSFETWCLTFLFLYSYLQLVSSIYVCLRSTQSSSYWHFSHFPFSYM